jgi:hypothetical protein
MSDKEEVLVLPRKRRRVCPKIPYVFGDTIVYGCERCMPLRDIHWVTWMWTGEKIGLPKEIAELIGGRLDKPWVEWKTWEPTSDVSVQIPVHQVSLMSRFCCDIHDDCVVFDPFERRQRTCYCKSETWTTLSCLKHGRQTSPEDIILIDFRVSSKYPTFFIKAATNK